MPTSQEIASLAGTPQFNANAYIAALVAEEQARNAATQAAYISPAEDARLEQIKHDVAFSQPRNDNSGPQSEAFMAINAAYQRQHSGSIGSGGQLSQTPEAQAAFRLQPGYVQNTGVDTGRAAFQNFGAPLTPSRYATELANQPSRSTVPTRDLSSGMSDIIFSSLPGAGTVTAYTPYGDRAQTELQKVKIGYGETGEVGFYQQPYGHSILNLASSGSRNALQSGMFTVNKPETPVVYTQESAGTKFAATANVPEALKVIVNPDYYSRLGAEVYGGFVKPLAGATVESVGAQLSTYANPNNLANLVSPGAVNLGKGALPGANIPWSVPSSAPAVASFETILLPTPFTSVGKIAGMGTTPSTVGSNPIEVTTTSLLSGKLPPVGALWAATPIAKIINNWSWESRPLEETARNIAATTSRGTEGLLNTAAILPFTSEAAVPATSLYGIAKAGFLGTNAALLAGTAPLVLATVAPSITPGAKGRAESLLQGYGGMTDLTVGFIPSIFGQKFTPFADQNQRTGLGADNSILTNANVKINAADVAAKNSWSQQDTLYGNYLTSKGEELKAKDLAFGLKNDALIAEGAKNTSGGYWTGDAASLAVYNKKIDALKAEGASLTKEFGVFSGETDALNKKAQTSNVLYQNIEDVRKAQVASGAYVYRNGQLMENPEMKRPYGAFSDWANGAANVLGNISGITPEKYSAFQVTRNAMGEVKESPSYGILSGLVRGEQQKTRNLENFGYGALGEVATNPGGLVLSAGSGLQIGILSGGIGEIGSAIAAKAVAAEGAGLLPKVVMPLVKLGENPLVKYGGQYAVPAAFVGSGVWSATEGFTLPAAQASMNVGQMGTHLAAMGAGAMAPELFTSSVKYGQNRFVEKPMVEHTVVNQLDYVQRPDIQVPSGVGGDIKYTQTTTLATQPSLNIFGREFTAPRIFSPKERMVETQTTHLLGGDIGSLLETRLPGSGSTATNPLVGSRIETLRVSEYGSEVLARGTGNVKIGEMRLPHTIDEYLKMGAADAKRTGLSHEEEVAASLMSDASKVTLPKSEYRMLDVAVTKGTHPLDAFDWTANVKGGKDIAFNRYNPEDFFRSMQVTTERGGKVVSQETATRDILGGMSGMYDVTGIKTPESKVVSQLQEVSKNIRPFENERGYGFDSRGNLVSEVLGKAHGVQMFPMKEQIIEKAGTEGTFAHTHPYSPALSYLPKIYGMGKLDLFGVKSLGIKPDLSFKMTRGKVSGMLRGREAESLPSKFKPGEKKGDVYVYSFNDALGNYNVGGRVASEIVVSKAGVRIFRPDVNKGWDIYRELNDASPRTDMWGRSGKTKALKTFSDVGIDTTFVKPGEKYVSKGYTERLPDVTKEMQRMYPQGLQSRVQNMIDRMALKNPSLEFVREVSKPQPSLSKSGGNIGKHLGGNQPPSAMSPMAPLGLQSSLVQTGERVVGSTRRGSNSGLSLPQKQRGGIESVRSVLPEQATVSKVAKSSEASRMFILGSAPSLSIGSISSQASISRQKQSQPSKVDMARAFDMASSSLSLSKQKQDAGLEFARAFDVRSLLGQKSNVKQDNVRAFEVLQIPSAASKQEVSQSPLLGIITGVGQVTGQKTGQIQGQKQTPIQQQKQITPQVPEIKPVEPRPKPPKPPVIPIIKIPGMPGFGGGTGSSQGRGGKKFREVMDYNFNVGGAAKATSRLLKKGSNIGTVSVSLGSMGAPVKYKSAFNLPAVGLPKSLKLESSAPKKKGKKK